MTDVPMRESKNEGKKSKAVARPYEPSDREREAVGKQFARRRAGRPSPTVKVKGNQISVDHEDGALGYTLLMEALGSADYDFVGGLLGQLANVTCKGRDVDPASLNFALTMVKGIEPRDQVEAMLGAQMAAVHLATMTFARRLAHVDNIQQQDSAERAFNKLARTFAAQVEALKRYRSKGEQRVYVERVNVEPGGQAIVGNVNQRGEG